MTRSDRFERELHQASTTQNFAMIAEVLANYPWMQGIAYRLSSIQFAIESNQLDLLAALLQGSIVYEQDSHRRGEKKQTLVREIIVACLCKDELEYWLMVAPHLARFLESSDFNICSPSLLRYFHEQNQILIPEWIVVLNHYANRDQVRERWEIRAPPGRELTEQDREMIRRILFAMIADEKTEADCPEVIEFWLEIYPRAISDQIDPFLETLIPIKRWGRGYRQKIIFWIFQVDGELAADLDSWMMSKTGDHSICNLLRFIEVTKHLMHYYLNFIGLLADRSKRYPIQYYFCPKLHTGMVTNRDVIDGMPNDSGKSFLFAGRYFYLQGMVFDRETNKMRFTMDQFPDLPISAVQALDYPEEEELIEIACGPEYSEPITIAAPVILLEWYWSSKSSVKGAR